VKDVLPEKAGAQWRGRGMGIVSEMTLVEFKQKIMDDQSGNGVTVVSVSDSHKYYVADGLFAWSKPVRQIISLLGLDGYVDDTQTCFEKKSLFLEYDAIIKVIDPKEKDKKSSPPTSPALVGSKCFQSPPPTLSQLTQPTSTSTTSPTTSTTSAQSKSSTQTVSVPKMTWSQVFPLLYEKYQARLFRPILRQLIRKQLQ